MVVRPFMFWSRPLEGHPRTSQPRRDDLPNFAPTQTAHTVPKRTSRVGVTDFEGVGSARAQYTETIADLGIC